MVSDELILKISRAIAQEEGFNVANSVPQRAHNPGDLTDDGDVGLGTVQTSGPHGAKITIYATDADGWAALYRKVRRMLSGASHTYTPELSLIQVGLKWAGDPNWGRNVADVLGIDPQMTLAEIASEDMKRQDGAQEA